VINTLGLIRLNGFDRLSRTGREKESDDQNNNPSAVRGDVCSIFPTVLPDEIDKPASAQIFLLDIMDILGKARHLQEGLR
jgi:hypothetical protein